MQAATLTAVVVFPTPPFWLAMAYTMPMTAPDASGARGGSGRSGRCARCWCALSADFWRTAGVSWPFPARRGKPGGVGATLRSTCSVRRSEPANGDDGPDRLRREPELPRRPRRRPRPRLVAPRPSTPRARRPRAAAARRTRTAPAATRARARRRRRSARARRPTPRRAPTRPRRSRGPSPRPRDRRNSHLRPAASTRTTRASGSTAASTRPGSPAPAPRSAISRRVAELGDLEAGERVGDVHVDARARDRARRSAPPASRAARAGRRAARLRPGGQP